jgi:hypothetical protein
MIGFCRIQLLNKGKNNIHKNLTTPASQENKSGGIPLSMENNNALGCTTMQVLSATMSAWTQSWSW